MSFQSFILLEAQALDVIKRKDPGMVWKAIECGVPEKMRAYAEDHQYEVTKDDLVEIIWKELCEKLPTQEWGI